MNIDPWITVTNMFSLGWKMGRGVEIEKEIVCVGGRVGRGLSRTTS